PLNTAFKVADEVLASSVKGITELVTKVGLVNLDFADLRTILKDAGCAVIGFGESNANVKPDEMAITAVENALNSPLLDSDISEADKALVNVTGGGDMTLREAELVIEEISKRINPNSHIIWGARIEPDLGKSVMKVLVVIAGAKLPNYEKVEFKQEPPEIDLDSII
ncbi:MAG: cell division protein FtsZ, partial [Candidatus Micrarchaeota archaeon]|nr:cell division protein FtsZ [Candidatus Micrarchaeota archaeon]